MSEIDLTHETLTHIATLPSGVRRRVIEEVGRQEWDRCADDPMYWMDASRHPLAYVHTRDPKQLYICTQCEDGNSITIDGRITHLTIRHGRNSDQVENIHLAEYFRELPTTRPFTVFPYIEPLVKTWLREKILFIEKSRDMMITWLVVTLYAWDTLFHKNRENIFQSDDSPKAYDLVERAFFIWDNQPAFLKNVHRATLTAGSSRSGILRIPTLNSVIYGFPQGPDQIRQFHPSGVFQDEAAFMIKAEEAFTAVKPAIQGGGRFTAVSSANPGWFYKCCRDVVE